MELHAFDDLVHHGLPVEHGEVLDDLHVVDIPVSYTHLDVYKRQSLFRIKLLLSIIVLQPNDRPIKVIISV